MSLGKLFDLSFGTALSLGKLFDFGVGAGLCLSEICHRRFEAREVGANRLTKDPHILLRCGVLGFFKHCAECLREALGPFLAEDYTELLVDHKRVHKGHHNDSSPEL